MKSIKYTLIVFLFLLCPSVFADTNWVKTTTIDNLGPGNIKLHGLTSSTTPSNASKVEVYFEYGIYPSSLTKSTTPQNITSLTLDTNKEYPFEATVTDAVQGYYNIFQAVRKTTYSDGTAPTYIRDTVLRQVYPLIENTAPEIKAIVSYLGSSCTTTTCSISIPENFSPNNTLAKIYALEQNSNQTLSANIIGGNTNGAFYIDSYWQIRVANKSLIDYETINSFDLVVEVRDNGVPQKTDTVTLHITITNVVDENVPDATYSSNYTSGASSVSYNVSGNLPTYSSASNVVNPTVGYLYYDNGSTYSSNPTFGTIPLSLYNNSAYTQNNGTYNTNSSLNNQSLNYVYGNSNGGTFGSLGYLNNLGINYTGQSNTGSTYNNTGANQTLNTNYYNQSSANQTLSEQQRQQEIRQILEIMVALKAEIDRRIALGIQ